MANWYQANAGDVQGLIACEETGRNVAVTYDKADAPLVAAAPAMLAALRLIYTDDDGDGYVSSEGMEAVRAWAERKARREADVHLRIGTAQYEHVKGELERVKALEASTTSLALEMSEEAAKRRRAVEDRARLAEQEAAEALAAREDLKRLLADAEARLAAAEAENAQLWAEIETLTAPQPALAA